MALALDQESGLQAKHAVSKQFGELPEPAEAVLELDHAIGYTSMARNGIALHPDGKHYILVSGACLGKFFFRSTLYMSYKLTVINNLDDPREQSFLSGHTQTITCLDVSNSVNFL